VRRRRSDGAARPGGAACAACGQVGGQVGGGSGRAADGCAAGNPVAGVRVSGGLVLHYGPPGRDESSSFDLTIREGEATQWKLHVPR
jgi:hypothetical protein